MLLITVLKYLFGYFVVVPSFKDINNFYSLLQYISEWVSVLFTQLHLKWVLQLQITLCMVPSFSAAFYLCYKLCDIANYRALKVHLVHFALSHQNLSTRLLWMNVSFLASNCFIYLSLCNQLFIMNLHFSRFLSTFTFFRLSVFYKYLSRVNIPIKHTSTFEIRL